MNIPSRPAWIEVDLAQLRLNFDLINRDKPRALRILSVVKDEAYGHGAVKIARVAQEAGASGLAVSTLEEALRLRSAGVTGPILLLGERPDAELSTCVAENLTCCVHRDDTARALASLAHAAKLTAPVHVEIDTGMSRYGVRWNSALPLLKSIAAMPSLVLEGVMSHFAMSDEPDKSFARLQTSRFREVIDSLAAAQIKVPILHLCNSGGFLDLPDAHLDMVRLGLLPLGVYPSPTCRRIQGIRPVMSVKTKIASLQQLQPGDTVGYGMRYVATSPRRIAVLPLGYGDGFPRVRNEGSVLIHGRRAPLVGSVSMDAVTVDVTDIPSAQLWDEVMVMGCQGDEEISAHDLAALKKSVSYDILTNWRSRLPRVYLGDSK